MSALRYSPEPERFVTVAEYIELDAASDTKHEYLEGRVYAMAGGTAAHSRITFKISTHIGRQLDGSSCEGYSADMRIHVPGTTLYSYPDAAFVCGEPEYNEEGTILLNPTVLIEVLSLSTESRDRSEKWLRYQRLPSLRDYLLVAQHEPRIEHFSRLEGSNSWLCATHRGLGAEFALSGATATVRLGDVYSGIDFPSPQADF